MEISALLNLDIITRKPYRWHGVLTEIRFTDSRVGAMIISRGNRFSPTVYFMPEGIERVEEEYILLRDESDVLRTPRKEFDEMFEKSLPLFGLPIEDRYGVKFGTVNDARFNRAFEIESFIVSRSFFDDIDYGYVILPKDDLEEIPGMENLKGGLLKYRYARDEIPENPEQSGLMRKFFGFREEGRHDA